jgi:predicted nucleic acid-binding protein
LVVNRQLLFELESVLLRERFRCYLPADEALLYVVWLHERAERGPVRGGDIPRYTGASDDDYVVALALDVGAEVIVANDLHFFDHLDTIPVAVSDPRTFADSLLGY